jgi:hypothetical protein
LGRDSVEDAGVKLAFYEGRSFVSRLIKWVTWGKFSHVAVILDDGRILEAWHNPSAVRWIKHLGEGHEPGTSVELFDLPELPHLGAAEVLAQASIGAKYDFWGILGFVLRRRTHNRRKWFCSELAATICKVGGVDLIARTPPWKISPSMLATSPLLVPYGRAITGKTRTVIYPYPSHASSASKPIEQVKGSPEVGDAPFSSRPPFCHMDCANFVCADTGRCHNLEGCPKLADAAFAKWKAAHDAKTADYIAANPSPPERPTK